MNTPRFACFGRTASWIAVGVLACACSGADGGADGGVDGFGGSSAASGPTSTDATSTSAASGGAIGSPTPGETVELCRPTVGGPGAAEISWAVCDLPFDWEEVRVAVDAEGDTFVTGLVDTCSANGCVVLEKIDPQGNVAWQLTASSGNTDSAVPANGVDVRVDASDHVWLGLDVVGETTIGGATIPTARGPNGKVIAQPVLAQIDVDGAVVTTIVPQVSELTRLVDFGVDDAGAFVVLADVGLGSDSIDGQLLTKVDASGESAWTQQIPADINGQGAFRRVQTTATGDVVLGGTTVSLDYPATLENTGAVFAGFDSAGTHTWSRDLVGSETWSFTLDAAAQVLAPRHPPLSDQPTLVTFDVGAGEIQDTIPLPEGTNVDGDVTLDATGDLLFAGTSSGQGAWVIAMTREGVVTWRAFVQQGWMTAVAANQAASIVAGMVDEHGKERTFVAKLNR